MTRKIRRQKKIELEQDLYKSCTSKKKYKTEIEAWSSAKFREAYGKIKVTLRTYFCHHCNYWHLTSK